MCLANHQERQRKEAVKEALMRSKQIAVLAEYQLEQRRLAILRATEALERARSN